eukprot:481557_1
MYMERIFIIIFLIVHPVPSLLEEYVPDNPLPSVVPVPDNPLPSVVPVPGIPGLDEPLETAFCALQTALETKIENIPNIDQIPTVVSKVNNIPSVVTQVNNIPSIVTQVHNIPSIVSQVNIIPSVVPSITEQINRIPYINEIPSVVPTITRRIDDIPGNVADAMTNAINQIPPSVRDAIIPIINQIPPSIIDAIVPPITDTINGIPPIIVEEILPIITDEIIPIIADTIKDVIMQLLNGTISFLDLGTNSFGNTLKVCLDELADATFGDLPFPKIIDIPDIPFDPELLIYQLAAIPLSPLQPIIEYICTDSLDMIKVALNAWKNIPFVDVNDERRRRRNLYKNPAASDPDATNCKPSENDGFCKPAELDFDPASSGWEAVGTNVRIWLQNTLWAVGCFDQENGWKAFCFVSTVYTWDVLLEYIKLNKWGFLLTCEHTKEAIPVDVWPASKFQHTAVSKQCDLITSILDWVIFAIEKIRWAIAFHNDRMSSIKNIAQYKDRFSIIHNQHALKDQLNNEFSTLRRELYGISNENDSINTANQEKYSLREIKKAVDALQADFDRQYVGSPTIRWADGLTLGPDDNKYDGEIIDIGQEEFNQIFWYSNDYIIKRECESCTQHNRIIYYKRLTDLSTFDAYSNMKVWTSTNNDLGNDFNLYSTYQDAINGINAWTYCNYDEPNGGAFYECAPTNTAAIICEVTFDSNSGYNNKNATCRKATKFSISRGVQFATSAKTNTQNKIIIEEPHDINNGEELIVIKIKPYDLYIFMAVFIGCIALCMVIGIFIGRFTVRYDDDVRFSSIPKYDYNTSDVEHVKK